MMKKKRVLIIVNSGLLNAGVPKVMMDIYEGLHSEYQIDFIANSYQPEYFDADIKSKGSKIYYIGTKHRLTWKTEPLFNIFVRSIRVFRILLHNKYDVVHSNSGVLSGDDLFIAKICGIKTRISHAHGTYNNPTWILNRMYSEISRFLLKRSSTHRIAVSKIAGDTLFRGQNYDLILNSIDFKLFDDIVKTEHLGINILQVGYFCSNKNQLFSLKIVNALRDLGVSAHISFIGFEIEIGYRAKLEDFIGQNGLEKDVTFYPHDVNKFRIYPDIDYMILPSGTEGLSLVSLECQAARIPCIVSTGVPVDADMGLLKRVSLEDFDGWIRQLSSKPSNFTLNEEKKMRFDRNVFINAIRRFYNL